MQEQAMALPTSEGDAMRELVGGKHMGKGHCDSKGKTSATHTKCHVNPALLHLLHLV